MPSYSSPIKKSDNAATSLWSPSKGPASTQKKSSLPDLATSSSNKNTVAAPVVQKALPEPRQKATRRIDPGQQESAAVVSASLAVVPKSNPKTPVRDEGIELLRPGTVEDVDPKA